MIVASSYNVSECDIDPVKLSEELRLVGEDYADKKAAFKLLDEMRVPVRSEIALGMMTESPGLSVARAELLASASIAYREHVTAMVEAEREANRSRASWLSIQAKFEAMRTAEATRRAQLFHGR